MLEQIETGVANIRTMSEIPAVGDTRQRILDTARGLFNEAGLARVGVREIARALERR